MTNNSLSFNRLQLLAQFCKASLICLILLLTNACASRHVENFEESFFTFTDPEGIKRFTFILTLKNLNSQDELTLREMMIRQSNGERIHRNREQAAIPENPEDRLVPLKFRMEEIAHEKLTQQLKAIDYCTSGQKYEEEYEKGRYKIKGHCE